MQPSDINLENQPFAESFVSSEEQQETKTAQIAFGSLKYGLVEVSDDIMNKITAINLENQSSAEYFMSSKEQQEEMKITELSPS
ncbi:hypothetical protein HHI36_023123 [Cryptolaemus montrouzieri]|uniref:Uncharacterized protein n=1 Tax=Cryptolaemus montrouzieri TaxID=559131 RepID=A0ABD2PFN6_9CUCU